jgi:predicted PurR-regulated permease PerM
MQNSGTDRHLASAALALLIAGCLAVLHPFLTASLWAIILVSVTWPAFVRLEKLLGRRRNLAAILMTLTVALVMIAPFATVALGLADNAAQISAAMDSALARGFPDAPAWLGNIPLVGGSLHAYWQDIANGSSSLTDQLKLLLPAAQSVLLSAGKIVAQGLMGLGLSVFIAFFLFRDGEAIGQRATSVVKKVAGDNGRRLLVTAQGTVTGVVYGILGTALAQGVLAGIGFAIAGVPGALLLGLGTFFLSVVPVGPPLIWGGAALWLFEQGDTGWAIFIVLWGILAVSMVDNILKPMIISRGSSLPFVLVFLGVLGGAVTFGLVGVFLGPTLLAVGYRLINEWSNSLIDVEKDEKPAA